MRKVSISALVFCLILGTAVLAMAKGTSMSKSHMTKGSVTAVNTTGNSFTVKAKTDETFMVSTSTKITQNGKPITLADVKVGDSVQVWYTANAGKNEASKVIVHAAKPAKTSKPSR
jgi:hypothetical protein